MNLLDKAVLVLYFAVLVIVGLIGTKKAQTREEYVLAGRNLGLIMYCGCLCAVIIGGAATIGTAKLGYQFGISGMWFVVMLGLGILLLGLIFSNRFSKLHIATISEFLGKRYNPETRLLSAVVAVIYTIMVTVTQVIGMGTIIHSLLGWDLSSSMLLGGGIVLFYTFLGGMWSVTMTDMIQFIIMTVGIFAVMLPLSLSHVGGWHALISHLPASHLNLTNIGGKQIFQYFLLYALGMVVSQDILQRVFTAKSAKISKQGAVFACIYSVAWAIALSVVGMCARIALPEVKDPQNVFANMATTILPPGLFGLVLAAVCSALMSNASGSLLASSTLLTNDIIKGFWLRNLSEKRYVSLSRVITLMIGIFSIIVAIWIQDLLVALDVAYAILSGAIFVPVVLGIFWKRATPRAGFFAVIVSTMVVILGLIMKGISSTDPIMYGIATSIVVMVILSLLNVSKKTTLDDRISN
jgi:SSS family solute:Na+ symporter